MSAQLYRETTENHFQKLVDLPDLYMSCTDWSRWDGSNLGQNLDEQEG